MSTIAPLNLPTSPHTPIVAAAARVNAALTDTSNPHVDQLRARVKNLSKNPRLIEAAQRWSIISRHPGDPLTQQAGAAHDTARKLARNPRLSTSNHVVFYWAANWYKLSRNTSELAVGELLTESAALRLAGVKNVLTTSPKYGALLITPDLGAPMDDRAPLAQYADRMSQNWIAGAQLGQHSLIPDVSHMGVVVRFKMGQRLSEASGELKEDLYRLLPAVGDYPVLGDEPWGLNHADPHYANWVRRDGDLFLLDWEHAVMGPREVDLAAFAHSCLVIDGDVESFRRLRKLGSPVLFDLFFRTKAVSAAAWVAWQYGEEAARSRVAALSPYLGG